MNNKELALIIIGYYIIGWVIYAGLTTTNNSPYNDTIANNTSNDDVVQIWGVLNYDSYCLRTH